MTNKKYYIDIKKFLNGDDNYISNECNIFNDYEIDIPIELNNIVESRNNNFKIYQNKNKFKKSIKNNKIIEYFNFNYKGLIKPYNNILYIGILNLILFYDNFLKYFVEKNLNKLNEYDINTINEYDNFLYNFNSNITIDEFLKYQMKIEDIIYDLYLKYKNNNNLDINNFINLNNYHDNFCNNYNNNNKNNNNIYNINKINFEINFNTTLLERVYKINIYHNSDVFKFLLDNALITNINSIFDSKENKNFIITNIIKWSCEQEY